MKFRPKTAELPKYRVKGTEDETPKEKEEPERKGNRNKKVKNDNTENGPNEPKYRVKGEREEENKQ
jgi:hypothetical protein